jgi:putative acetyltransferase
MVGIAGIDMRTGGTGCYMHPQYAGQGVGRALLEATFAEAKARNITEGEIHATQMAVGFYEKMGYVPVEATTHRLRTGHEIPVVRMTRRFIY